MLKLFPKHHFAKLEAEHGTGRQARSFTRWSQLVHLLSMQLTARVSLRDAQYAEKHTKNHRIVSFQENLCALIAELKEQEGIER